MLSFFLFFLHCFSLRSLPNTDLSNILLEFFKFFVEEEKVKRLKVRFGKNELSYFKPIFDRIWVEYSNLLKNKLKWVTYFGLKKIKKNQAMYTRETVNIGTVSRFKYRCNKVIRWDSCGRILILSSMDENNGSRCQSIYWFKYRNLCT